MWYYKNVKDKENLYTPPSWGKQKAPAGSRMKEGDMTRKEWIERKNKEYNEAKEAMLKHCKYSHSVTSSEYISRKIQGKIVPYKGLFGTGYKEYIPDPNSKKRCIVSYYLEGIE